MSEKQSGCGIVPDFGGSPENRSEELISPAQGAKGRGSPAGAPLQPANSTKIYLHQKTIRPSLWFRVWKSEVRFCRPNRLSA